MREQGSASHGASLFENFIGTSSYEKILNGIGLFEITYFCDKFKIKITSSASIDFAKQNVTKLIYIESSKTIF